MARAFVALLCIALVLWFSATVPSASPLDLAIPVLLFCFLVVVRLTLLRVSDGEAAEQAISLLTVHISRAPPLA